MGSDREKTIDIDDKSLSNNVKNDLKDNFNLCEEEADDIAKRVNTNNMNIPEPKKQTIKEKIQNKIKNNNIINLADKPTFATIKDVEIGKDDKLYFTVDYNGEQYEVEPTKQDVSNFIKYKGVDRIIELEGSKVYIRKNVLDKKAVFPTNTHILDLVKFSLFEKSTCLFNNYYPVRLISSDGKFWDYINLATVYVLSIYPLILSSFTQFNIIILSTLLFIPCFILLFWMSIITICYYLSNTLEGNYSYRKIMN